MLKKTLIAATALSAVALGADLRPPTTRAITIFRGILAIRRGAIQAATTRRIPEIKKMAEIKALQGD